MTINHFSHVHKINSQISSFIFLDLSAAFPRTHPLPLSLSKFFPRFQDTIISVFAYFPLPPFSLFCWLQSLCWLPDFQMVVPRDLLWLSSVFIPTPKKISYCLSASSTLSSAAKLGIGRVQAWITFCYWMGICETLQHCLLSPVLGCLHSLIPFPTCLNFPIIVCFIFL